MPEKKKMFKDLHERWKEADIPVEWKKVLDRIEHEIVGIDQEKNLRKLIEKVRQDFNNSELWFSLGIRLAEIEKYERAMAALSITTKITEILVGG